MLDAPETVQVKCLMFLVNMFFRKTQILYLCEVMLLPNNCYTCRACLWDRTGTPPESAQGRRGARAG